MKPSAPFLRKIYLSAASESNGYPFDLPLFKNDFHLEIKRPVTIISGENGTGKSTLLEAIALNCGFSLEGGSRNHMSPPDPLLSSLEAAMTFSWLPRTHNGFFMRAESFYNFATSINQIAEDAGAIALAPYGGKSLHDQSHGEAFLSLFTNRIHSKGLYVLDEPEAALSPMRQLSLLSILRQLEKSGKAQVIMATHSPILMAYPTAQFMYIDDDGLSEVDYRKTPHFMTLKRFLERPDLYFRSLFE